MAQVKVGKSRVKLGNTQNKREKSKINVDFNTGT